MNWELILQVTAPIFLVMGYVWNKIDKRFDALDKRMERTENCLVAIDRRLSHLEGRFEERGYWESRRTGTEIQK
jgi:hypothetical protein